MSKELQSGGGEQSNPGKPKEVLIPESILKILERSSLPPKQKQELVIQIASHFSGPLPHPDVLREYDAIVANGAERIFQGFEAQTKHRLQLEDFAVKSQIKQSGRGQIFGFIIAVLGLGLATVLAIYGFEILASVIGGTTLVGLVTIFVLGKSGQRRDIEKKKKE